MVANQINAAAIVSRGAFRCWPLNSFKAYRAKERRFILKKEKEKGKRRAGDPSTPDARGEGERAGRWRRDVGF